VFDLLIKIRGCTYTRSQLLDADEAYEAVRQYLLAFAISVLLSDDFRDRAGFVEGLTKSGAFEGTVVDAEITITRSP
jgi:hypothetical protein